jgi:hypothetical protein
VSPAASGWIKQQRLTFSSLDGIAKAYCAVENLTGFERGSFVLRWGSVLREETTFADGDVTNGALVEIVHVDTDHRCSDHSFTHQSLSPEYRRRRRHALYDNRLLPAVRSRRSRMHGVGYDYQRSQRKDTDLNDLIMYEEASYSFTTVVFSSQELLSPEYRRRRNRRRRHALYDNRVLQLEMEELLHQSLSPEYRRRRRHALYDNRVLQLEMRLTELQMAKKKLSNGATRQADLGSMAFYAFCAFFNLAALLLAYRDYHPRELPVQSFFNRGSLMKIPLICIDDNRGLGSACAA